MNSKTVYHLTHPIRFIRKVKIVLKGAIYNLFGCLMIAFYSEMENKLILMF